MIYKAVFAYIHKHVMSLECEIFMTDYERALRNGLLAIVPNAKVRGCWFHFKQAAKRNAKKFPELMVYVKEEDQAKEIYYQLLALPLLPADLIRTAFEGLTVRAFNLNQDAFKRFLNYFGNQWINAVNILLHFLKYIVERKPIQKKSLRIFRKDRSEFRCLILNIAQPER